MGVRVWGIVSCPKGLCLLLHGMLVASRRPNPRFPMEESLPKQLVRQVAGSFDMTALLQKRVRELVRGQKPLYETRERNYIKIASEEIRRGLIQLVEDEEQQDPEAVL